MSKGLSQQDADAAIRLLSKNQELFLDIMMAEGKIPSIILSGLVIMSIFFPFP